jgi:hypothetical protein
MTKALDEILERVARRAHPAHPRAQVTHELQPREIDRPCPECGADEWEIVDGPSFVCLVCGFLAVELPDPPEDELAVTANQIYAKRKSSAKQAKQR